MPFAIIDQGFRVQTPLRSLFPEKGVAKTSAATHSQNSTDAEKDTISQQQNFSTFLDQNAQQQQSIAKSGTYDSLKPNQQANTHKSGLTAAQIMSTPVLGIPLGTTTHAAWERMQELNVSHLMVENAAGKPVGILSSKDILIEGTESTKSITNIYSPQLIAGAPTTEITQISACFIEFDINAIPIFNEEDQLVGIICRSDLLRLIISGAHVEGWA